MDFGLSDEQLQLKASTREFLANECPTAYVRKAMADESGAARELYDHIAKLGWNGLVIPEKFGGAGLSMLDMAVVLEECGYAAMPGPFLFSSAIAASALGLGGSEKLQREYLPALAEGRAICAIAIADENASIAASGIVTRAQRRGADWTLDGVKMFVPYAHLARMLIVAARTGAATDDVDLFAIPSDSAGLRIRLLSGIDLTRRVCRVDLHGVAVSADARLSGGASLLARVADIGAVAIAADSLGGAQRALDMAVEYSKIREQFGKPIGSFQALKHLAADIVSELEPARALLWYAAYALDALPDAAPRAAAMAKARLSEVYSCATDRAVLMHGGIGFTWEHDIHLWFKRARFNDSCFGSPAFHRERVATLSNY